MHLYICEGPRCVKGEGAQRVTIPIDPVKAQLDSTYSPPDVFFRLLVVRSSYEEPKPNQRESTPVEHHFCSSSCLRDYYNENNYTPPRSPREQNNIKESNAIKSGEN